VVKKRLPIYILAAITCFLLAAFQIAPKIFSTQTGEVSFTSNAPLEVIKASSKNLKGVVDIEKRTFAFKLANSTLNGFNSGLQKEHFHENYMETEKYPEASFSGKIIEGVDLSTDGTYDVRAKGKFTVHGVEQERIIHCIITVGGGKINVQSTFSVLLTDHNIAIPKVVHEKLANEIQVTIKADLKPQK
jgi:polyisoprenoid-binding protein YceI